MQFIVGLVVGLLVGWMCGTWSEHRLWLDAICGRERIWKSRLSPDSKRERIDMNKQICDVFAKAEPAAIRLREENRALREVMSKLVRTCHGYLLKEDATLLDQAYALLIPTSHPKEVINE